MLRFAFVAFVMTILAADSNAAGITDRLVLRPGFEAEVYARFPRAREIEVIDGGRLVFVSTRSDRIYVAVDEDGDFKPERTGIFAEGMNVPHGLAHDRASGDLYVVEQDKVRRFTAPDYGLDPSLPDGVLWRGLPDLRHHGWRAAAMGPDGMLYFAVGVACNICLRGGYEASLLRIALDGTAPEIIATGVRNSVGFDWQPGTDILFFTDNGGDNLGDHVPPDELNMLREEGQFFGFPYLYGDGTPYPQFEGETPPGPQEIPVFNFTAHSAPLGILFYTGDQFPADYKGDAFVAQHGSWNRDPSDPSGYFVSRVKFEDGMPVSKEIFIGGFLNDDLDSWGRPAQLAMLPDGSLLVSDDKAGAIYRITYRGE